MQADAARRDATRQVVLDTETTGLEWKKGNRVVEIGCVELVERRPTGRTFHCYLNPDREMEPGAQEVTGLTLEFLADKPRFPEVADEFLAFVEGAELVIHNAAFDIGFLDAELERLAQHPSGKRKRDIGSLNEVLGDIIALCYADAQALVEPNRMPALEV